MPTYLARMLSYKAKWKSAGADGDAVPADAIVRDLYTTDNTLSFWRCDPDRPETLDNVVVALASNRDNLAHLDLVIVSEEALRQANISVIEKLGDTPAATLNPEHRDLAGLTLTSLVVVAGLMHAALQTDATSPRIPLPRVREKLRAAIQTGILQAYQIKPSLAAKLQ